MKIFRVRVRSPDLSCEITNRKTVLQSSADELQQIRNRVDDKQIFLVVDETILCGIQYLNIPVGSLETSHVSYLYVCQPPPCPPSSNSIVRAVDDTV